MMVTSKHPRTPTQQYQNGYMFPGTMMRTEHLQNTMNRKVYLLDGYGVLHTISRTATALPKDAEIGLAITTAINHDMVSDSVQIEDRPHLRSPDDIREITRVSGGAHGCSLVMSHTVVFTQGELTENEVVYDKNSNYHVSLSRDALLRVSADRLNPTKVKTANSKTDNCTLALNMVIVDNRKDSPTSYFVNLAGRVYKVPVTVNPEIEDGVWIESNRPEVGPDKAEFQSLNDSIYVEDRKVIPPVTLFTSALEAKRFGDESAQSKERERLHNVELTDLKHALEKAKAENAKYKEELDRRAAERNDYYAERSTRRKDDSENIGIVAKVITGVVAVAGALVGLVRWFT